MIDASQQFAAGHLYHICSRIAIKPSSRLTSAFIGIYNCDDELDVLISTIRLITLYIDRQIINGRKGYAIWIETAIGENFADRWNLEPQRAKAFFAWQEKVLSNFLAFRDALGLDGAMNSSKSIFESKVVDRVMDKRNSLIGDARKCGIPVCDWTRPSYRGPIFGFII